MNGSTLVSTQELASRLGAWRVFDCRHDLMKPDLGAQQYRAAHIPGALFAHMEHDLSGPKTGKNGRHPLPDPDVFASWLSRQGIRREDQVICYDAVNGSAAARLWWMLRWVGHESVAVLDGGFAKWTKEGRPVDASVSQFKPGLYSASKPSGAVSADTVLKSPLLLDARAPARWRGEQEPIDPIAGRIPGARNRFSAENVNADGTFKDAASLKKDFLSILGNQDPADVVHYCGSGVAACHNLLAMEIAGLPGGKLYPGSWSEWIADPSRPQEKS